MVKANETAQKIALAQLTVDRQRNPNLDAVEGDVLKSLTKLPPRQHPEG